MWLRAGALEAIQRATVRSYVQDDLIALEAECRARHAATLGRPVVYLAENAALALLEVRVHLDLPPDLLPDDYVLLGVDLADLAIERLTTPPPDPRAAGDTWLASRRTPVLQVPSIIIPECTNLLLNPQHPEAGRASVVGKRRFQFDGRLWLAG